MDIISIRGEQKVAAADVLVIGNPGMLTTGVCAKLTNSAGFTRTPGQTGLVSFDTIITDTGKMIRSGAPISRIYATQSGYYLVNFYLGNFVGTTHTETAQLWAVRSGVSGYFGYKTKKFYAATLTYPNMISVSGIVYVEKDDYFYCHWGSSHDVTSHYTEPWMGFGAWKAG